MQFAEWLNQQMRQRGMSSRQLARETGTSLATISNWRCGRNKPVPGTCKRLAILFGADVEELIRLAAWADE